MKSTIIYFIFLASYLAINIILDKFFIELSLLTVFLISLGSSLSLLFGGGFLLNYHEKAVIKTCLIHAASLAILACIISLVLIMNQGDIGEAHIKTYGFEESLSSNESQTIEWEATFVEQDIPSRIAQTGFDFFVAITGGMYAMKLYDQKSKLVIK